MMHRALEFVKSKDRAIPEIHSGPVPLLSYSLPSPRRGVNPFLIVFSLTLTGFIN